MNTSYNLLKGKDFEDLFGQIESVAFGKNVIIEINHFVLGETESIQIGKWAERFEKAGYSMVVLSETLSPDMLPEFVNLSPTLQEAEDTIQLEAISRDLGL